MFKVMLTGTENLYPVLAFSRFERNKTKKYERILEFSNIVKTHTMRFVIHNNISDSDKRAFDHLCEILLSYSQHHDILGLVVEVFISSKEDRKLDIPHEVTLRFVDDGKPYLFNFYCANINLDIMEDALPNTMEYPIVVIDPVLVQSMTPVQASLKEVKYNERGEFEFYLHGQQPTPKLVIKPDIPGSPKPGSDFIMNLRRYIATPSFMRRVIHLETSEFNLIKDKEIICLNARYRFGEFKEFDFDITDVRMENLNYPSLYKYPSIFDFKRRSYHSNPYFSNSIRNKGEAIHTFDLRDYAIKLILDKTITGSNEDLSTTLAGVVYDKTGYLYFYPENACELFGGFYAKFDLNTHNLSKSIDVFFQHLKHFASNADAAYLRVHIYRVVDNKDRESFHVGIAPNVIWNKCTDILSWEMDKDAEIRFFNPSQKMVNSILR